MIWSIIGTIPVTQHWAYTPVVNGTYFRLLHIDAPFEASFDVCQAEKSNSEYQIFDIRKYCGHLPIIIRASKPAVFDERLIGIRSNDENGRWKILIEVSDAEDGFFLPPTSSSGGLTWSSAATDQQMVNNSGYFINAQSTINLTLPVTAVAGDTLAVVGVGAGGWCIKQNAGQAIQIANQTSEPGVRGGIKSSNRNDCIEMICTTNNTNWVVRNSSGNVRTFGSYANAVLALQPYLYWRLNETSGTIVADSSPNNRGATYSGNYTLGVTGLLASDSSFAVQCNGSAFICASDIIPNPQNFTLEFIFRTSNINVGLINFGDTRNTSPGSYDRQVYLDSVGRLNFYVFPGGAVTTPQPYNDGKKHHVAVICDAQGRRIFVDGIQVVNAAVSAPTAYSGYWALGFSRTPNTYLTGVIDEFAYYTSSLSDADIADHASLI